MKLYTIDTGYFKLDGGEEDIYFFEFNLMIGTSISSKDIPPC